MHSTMKTIRSKCCTNSDIKWNREIDLCIVALKTTIWLPTRRTQTIQRKEEKVNREYGIPLRKSTEKRNDRNRQRQWMECARQWRQSETKVTIISSASTSRTLRIVSVVQTLVDNVHCRRCLVDFQRHTTEMNPKKTPNDTISLGEKHFRFATLMW